MNTLVCLHRETREENVFKWRLTSATEPMGQYVIVTIEQHSFAAIVYERAKSLLTKNIIAWYKVFSDSQPDSVSFMRKPAPTPAWRKVSHPSHPNVFQAAHVVSFLWVEAFLSARTISRQTELQPVHNVDVPTQENGWETWWDKDVHHWE